MVIENINWNVLNKDLCTEHLKLYIEHKSTSSKGLYLNHFKTIYKLFFFWRVVSHVFLRFMAADYLFGIFFDEHCHTYLDDDTKFRNNHAACR